MALARALANDPKVILADEPTGNLDTTTSEEIVAILSDLADEGRTVIIITHDRGVTRMARRVLHLRDGQIQPAGSKPIGGPKSDARST